MFCSRCLQQKPKDRFRKNNRVCLDCLALEAVIRRKNKTTNVLTQNKSVSVEKRVCKKCGELNEFYKSCSYFCKKCKDKTNSKSISKMTNFNKIMEVL